ncbi:MAG: hypothetical protein HYW25_04310 [Candidatus Aenigmarchaeota archaeon]|nr:hypothetical protein [Candidatus Aenigmarchaeota archaeon]
MRIRRKPFAEELHNPLSRLGFRYNSSMDSTIWVFPVDQTPPYDIDFFRGIFQSPERAKIELDLTVYVWRAEERGRYTAEICPAVPMRDRTMSLHERYSESFGDAYRRHGKKQTISFARKYLKKRGFTTSRRKNL